MQNKAAIAIVTATALGAIALGSGPAYAALVEYDGPMRWETPSVTVASTTSKVSQETLADVAAAWDGTVEIKVVSGPADITFIDGTCISTRGTCGGEADRTFANGNYIASCSIDVLEPLPELLTHEMGHCLGLSHAFDGTGTNMHWFAKDYPRWSDTVTAGDLGRLANLYR